MSEDQAAKDKRVRILQPDGWMRPRGYANGMVASGQLVFISGQIGWDGQGYFQASGFVEQVRQALSNILAILAEVDGRPEHITRLTWYIVDKQEYLACSKDLGLVYQQLMGDHYPVMSVVVVAGLLEDQARVEIEATAVLP